MRTRSAGNAEMKEMAKEEGLALFFLVFYFLGTSVRRTRDIQVYMFRDNVCPHLEMYV